MTKDKKINKGRKKTTERQRLIDKGEDKDKDERKKRQVGIEIGIGM
jgi:hypothetical protein